MPKTNPSPHPLAIVRKHLGWTQARLAEKCGVAAVTVKKIEGRTLKPGRELLGRIMLATGVDPESLATKSPTFMGLPYEAAYGRAHIEAFATKDKVGNFAVSDSAGQTMAAQIHLLGEILVSASRKNASHVAGWSFIEWAADTVSAFGLEKDFAKNPDDNDPAKNMLWNALSARKKARRAKTKD